MGDFIDLYIQRGFRSLVPVSASALCFQVRRRGQGPPNVTLNFLKSDIPSDAAVFTIKLGMINNIYFDEDDHISTPHPRRSISRGQDINNVLSEEWSEFWLTWHRGVVRVGRTGEETPLMERRGANLSQVKYAVTTSDHAQWKFLMGPKHPEPQCYPVTGGKPEWVPMGDSMPMGAVIGGYENEPLYIIRASHRGSLAPGKFVPSEGAAYIAWGYEAHRKEEFEVLVGYNFEWIAAADGITPDDALPGGFSENNNETLFIGRAMIDGHLIPGKVQPSYKLLYAPYKRKEIEISNYELLVMRPRELDSQEPRILVVPLRNALPRNVMSEYHQNSLHTFSRHLHGRQNMAILAAAEFGGMQYNEYESDETDD